MQPRVSWIRHSEPLTSATLLVSQEAALTEDDMPNRFQPSEDTFDDVEGHGASGQELPPEGDDSEGHAARGKAMLPEDDDSEGHAARGKAMLPEDDEDVEGHALKTGRPILPGERGRAGRTHDR
jgi:hypothetical protein